MNQWQHSLADDGANNWAVSGESVDSDGILAADTYQGIPVLLALIANNQPRLRLVRAIDGRPF